MQNMPRASRGARIFSGGKRDVGRPDDVRTYDFGAPTWVGARENGTTFPRPWPLSEAALRAGH